MSNLEKNLRELERISSELDAPQTTVDQSLKLYATSINLAKKCLDELAAAKGKFEQLNEELKKAGI